MSRPSLRAALAAAALTLSSVASVAVLAPQADARTAYTTSTSFAAGQDHSGTYGDTLYLSGSATDTDGSGTPYEGTTALQRLLPGGSWTTIDTSTSASYYGSTKLVSNAYYRLVYSGASDSSTGDSWTGSTSTPLKVSTARKLIFKDVSSGGQSRGRFTVRPSFAHKRVTVLRKGRGGFKAIAHPRTDGHGVVTITFQNRSGKGITYRVVSPADRKLGAASVQLTAVRY